MSRAGHRHRPLPHCITASTAGLRGATLRWLAQRQLEEERRGHPPVAATLGGAQSADQIVDLLLGRHACTEGALPRRGDGARVQLEPHVWVEGHETAPGLDDLEARLPRR